MMKCSLLLLLVVGAWAAPEEDLITSLPGLDYEVSFAQYSGMLDANEGQHLHYWFVESQRDPASDPVILWLNGGPGCSSMDGFFNENGPFKISEEDEVSLIQNPYSWNLNASVIYLDAPVGVGYSYSDDGSIVSDDDTTSMGNYLALLDFFTNKFPELSGNDFYIAGESYGGVYVPTLAQRVAENQSSFPLELKGWATGNGILSYPASDNSLIFYAYYHGLFDTGHWDKLVEHCCDGGIGTREACSFHLSTNPTCAANILEAESVIYWSGLNPYTLYGECKHPSENTRFQLKSFTRAGTPIWVSPCFDDHIIQNWFMSPEAREALHIPEEAPEEWLVCSHIKYTTLYRNMTSQFQYLNGKVKGLVYNGDWDMMCNFLGNEWFLEDLELTEVEAQREWYYDGQVAGFVKRWENVDFVTVRGAGHQVPEDRPEQSLKMIYNFINGEPL